ncbi:MAG: 50S ribosome-binding GTPase, partial [Bifidobacteriaceae bacterium]|nr:50S ribosome-binding GTPase [Bifidobacteriaceae bacterium]
MTDPTQPDQAIDKTEALRSALDEYDLDAEDLALLEAETAASGPPPVRSSGTLAIVGRPNVGKSTLVNRIVGRRLAVVQDQPGVTRDRVAYPAEWTGTTFMVVDTGGWEIDVAGLHARVAEQAELAVDLADAAILVVDANVGVTDTDAALVEVLRRSGKPVVLAANKVDGVRAESDATQLWSLGLGEPYAISALHGRGMG